MRQSKFPRSTDKRRGQFRAATLFSEVIEALASGSVQDRLSELLRRLQRREMPYPAQFFQAVIGEKVVQPVGPRVGENGIAGLPKDGYRRRETVAG